MDKGRSVVRKLHPEAKKRILRCMSHRDDPHLAVPLSTSPKLRVIRGMGQKKQEPLASRDAVARVLIEAGADLLLRRISPERAECIEEHVEAVLRLFERLDQEPALFETLQGKLDELESLMQDTRQKRALPPRRR